MASPDRLSVQVSRLTTPIAAVSSVVVVLLTASRLGPVVALSVAAVIAELAGLALVARWLHVDLRALISGRVHVKAVAAQARARVGVARVRVTPLVLEREIARLEGEIDAARRGAADEQRRLKDRLDELEQSLSARIREEARDPALGLGLVALGVILSACANIVGA